MTDSIDNKNEDLQFLYQKFFDLYTQEKKLTSDRTTIFLAFNSIIFLAFVQILFNLLTNTYNLGEGYVYFMALSIGIPFIALFTCVLHKLNLQWAQRASMYWKEKMLLIERNINFLPTIKNNKDMYTFIDVGLFNDRQKYIDEKYANIYPLDLITGHIPKEYKKEIPPFNPTTISEMWLPFSISIIWIMSFVIISYYLKDLNFDIAFIASLSVAASVYYYSDKQMHPHENKQQNKLLSQCFWISSIIVAILFLGLIIDFVLNLINISHPLYIQYNFKPGLLGAIELLTLQLMKVISIFIFFLNSMIASCILFFKKDDEPLSKKLIKNNFSQPEIIETEIEKKK